MYFKVLIVSWIWKESTKAEWKEQVTSNQESHNGGLNWNWKMFKLLFKFFILLRFWFHVTGLFVTYLIRNQMIICSGPCQIRKPAIGTKMVRIHEKSFPFCGQFNEKSKYHSIQILEDFFLCKGIGKIRTLYQNRNHICLFPSLYVRNKD